MIFGAGCVLLMIGFMIDQINHQEKYVVAWRDALEWSLVSLLILLNISGIAPSGSIATSVIWVLCGLMLAINRLNLNRFAKTQLAMLTVGWLLVCPVFWGDMHWV